MSGNADDILFQAAMSVKPPTVSVLSPQQLVACAPNPNDCGGVGGCDGSVPELAFDYGPFRRQPVRLQASVPMAWVPYRCIDGCD